MLLRHCQPNIAVKLNTSAGAVQSASPSPSNSALPSESLLRGQKTIEILHNGSLYKLQATKLGKLILTK